MKKQLLILPEGSGLTSKDREKLTKAGFIALEVKHPHLARLVSADGAELGVSQIALAAMTAIHECKFMEDVKHHLVRNLLSTMKAAEARALQG